MLVGARRAVDYPGKNGLPIDAGMLTRMNAALREMRTSTTIVARYGSMVRNWLGDLHALALQVQLQHRDAAEQVGAEQDARRPPGREGRQRQRDPALAGGHALDPQRRVDDRDVGAGDAAQRAADDHRGEADPPHRIAERVRRLGRLADRAQHQPGARAVEEPGDRRPSARSRGRPSGAGGTAPGRRRAGRRGRGSGSASRSPSFSCV